MTSASTLIDQDLIIGFSCKLGLSWLWQQWQETAPNYRRPATPQRPTVQQAPSLDNFDDEAGFDEQPNGENGGLNYPQVKTVYRHFQMKIYLILILNFLATNIWSCWWRFHSSRSWRDEGCYEFP